MDFGDIKLRLERIYSSINKQTDTDINKHLQILFMINHPATGENTFDIKMDCYKQNKEPEIVNILMGTIDNIAKIKDHIINIIESRGENRQIIEDEINNSLDLSIITDLSNEDKHGYPLKKTNRSNLKPHIKNPRTELQLVGKASITTPAIIPGKGIVGDFETEGDVRIIVDADIMNEQNDKIANASVIIENAIKQWEEVIKNLKIIG